MGYRETQSGTPHFFPSQPEAVRARATQRTILVSLIACCCALLCSRNVAADDRPQPVTLIRTPAGGLQPEALGDRSGTTHLVFLSGELGAADVLYTRRERGANEFLPPIRVNSAPGAAVAIGTVRGAHLALGREGRVHVAWNGAMKARPADTNGGSPMLYTRSNPARTAFEPQRNLMSRSTALDGGGTIAADSLGTVLVTWHGRPEGSPPGEQYRRMLVARSGDDGATFGPEESAWAEATGACACCGTGALAGSDGALTLIYRAAESTMERDLFLLSSKDRGKTFAGVRLDPWKVGVCPMSTVSLTEGPKGVVAAWETAGQVFMTTIDPKSGKPAEPIHPSGIAGRRKHPAVAVNERGEILIAWAEDTSFQRGGSLAWRLFDASGKQTPLHGRVENGVPHFSRPAAVARPDGSFLIVH